ncbi:unnamed protein product [Rotaria socialis]|uniref:Uncharacterized protein n=1 Tax=Rotaria socialis TaxID=392032 RepID=A0A817WRG0_9BILA|nr:unnamed protein product [Rotaria socialis]CAF3672421.1 unnamed protein product [Rotaria socialis]CAF4450143.1 unnamed protein product [Rotaria socialis]CAF4512787.1 unnamed protein product [Rotaria socialis]
MSLRGSSFSIHKSKARQFVSLSPLKISAAELPRELGTQYQTIDARIGDQKMTYNTEQGYWQSDGAVSAPINSRDMAKLEKTKRELEEDNDALRAKVEILLEMLAEVTAEHEIRHRA